jgi:uncharacterized membrane protein/nitrite reductase/ring-hydroxylating ferredoxin subunit
VARSGGATLRSKASVDGHPLHPGLIPFPFAFLFGAFLFDAGGLAFARPAWSATGYHLAIAGLATAVIAAIPGFIDYFATVPPRSISHSKATWHMVLALVTLVLFAVATWIRGGADAAPGALGLALELAGVLVLSGAGWIGGMLVVRDQISVDHRYAGNGRWNEASVERDADGSVVAASCGELGMDQMKLVKVDGRRIVLARTPKGYTAFDDACTHGGGSLAAGTLICGVVQCPGHGSQFDTRTGTVRAGPAGRPLNVYGVEASDGVIRIALPDGAAP